MFAEFAPLHAGLLAFIVARNPLLFNGPHSRDTYNLMLTSQTKGTVPLTTVPSGLTIVFNFDDENTRRNLGQGD
jgi:hypothetical protein